MNTILIITVTALLFWMLLAVNRKVILLRLCRHAIDRGQLDTALDMLSEARTECWLTDLEEYRLRQELGLPVDETEPAPTKSGYLSAVLGRLVKPFKKSSRG